MPLNSKSPHSVSSLPRTVGVIQARMGSSRLPGKVLHEIAGKPMLWHVVNRVRRAKQLHHVLVATSAATVDTIVADFCRWHNIDCFRGSENDVLDRYLQAARYADAEVVVRLTADCPLHDPNVIDAVITAFHSANFDYVSNVDPPTYPDGLDTEVFRVSALERAWWEAARHSEREHVTPYLRDPANGFRQGSVLNEQDYSGLRWTVDELPDLAFVRAVFHSLDTLNFSFTDVVALLNSQPQLRRINNQFTRNEGYLHSLQAERKAA